MDSELTGLPQEFKIPAWIGKDTKLCFECLL